MLVAAEVGLNPLCTELSRAARKVTSGPSFNVGPRTDADLDARRSPAAAKAAHLVLYEIIRLTRCWAAADVSAES